ncbi:MAG: energy transducer TonB [Acidobacteria bacterium]|nr:energy transducer TonB [Acidobacteriota bacterium]
MKIRYRSLFAVICMTAITANVPAGVAVQDRQEKKTETQTTQRTITVQGDGKTFTTVPDGVQEGTFNVRVAEPGAAGMGFAVVSGNGQQSGDGMFQFFSQEMSFDNRLVKDAPFSAETLSETVQTLADGNRIVQRSTGHAYRDGQGRTRIERSFRMGGSGGEQKTITIYDPTTGDNFILDPEKRTARKAKMFFRVVGQPIAGLPTPAQTSMTTEPPRFVVSGGVLQGSAIKRVQPAYPPVAKAAGADGAVQVQVTVSETGEVVDATVSQRPPAASRFFGRCRPAMAIQTDRGGAENPSRFRAF